MRREKPGFWHKKANRISAVTSLISRLNIPAERITKSDFEKHSLSYIYRYKKGICNALREAGFNPKRKRFPIAYWKTKMNRIKHTVKLCRQLKKNPEGIVHADFNRNHLSGLILEANGVRNALKEAGYTEIDEPKPSGHWAIRRNRIIAITKFIERCDKPLCEVIESDFRKAGISTVLGYYRNQHWRALRDAGYEIKPWQLKNLPLNFWNSKKNRIKAIKWLLRTTKKRQESLVVKDFLLNGLKQLIVKYGGVYKTLKNADFKIDPKRHPNGYWGIRTNRIEAIKKLVKSSGKPAEEVLVRDFKEFRIYSALRYYNDSAIEALRDAGFKISSKVAKKRRLLYGRDKSYISNHGHKFISIFERDLDNWLWERGIRNHRHNVRYPNSKRNCDIVIGKYWIEAAGLLRMQWYRRTMELKASIAQKYSLSLVTISIEEFRKKHILEMKLADVLRHHGDMYNKNLNDFAQ